jgi:hypothetical protein
MRLALLATMASVISCVPASGRPTADADQIMKVEEQFRLAKLNRDTRALDLILAEKFYETNQNGNSRNKAQTIELWTSFPIDSLTTDSADVKITGDTAVVTGSQTEHNGSGVDRMLCMRVYVRAGSTWQLLAAMQSRDPRS